MPIYFKIFIFTKFTKVLILSRLVCLWTMQRGDNQDTYYQKLNISYWTPLVTALITMVLCSSITY